MSLEPGTRLGSYEVVSELGSGGMGEVYKAKDIKLGRSVAIKLLHTEEALTSDRIRRFEQEARAASALNHPNIVTIHEIGEHEGAPFIAMEYVEGKTLREMLHEGPLPYDKLIRYATQLAEGVAKAHQAGIVHRDLKPENIVISEDGYVKILDFGLAKLMPEAVPVGSEMRTLDKVETREGLLVGTASYMSPEQALGKSLDARTDVFSLGAVLYEMATGRKPFQGETTVALFDEILHREVPPPSSLNPALPRDLDRVIGRALEKNPHQRYASAKELLADLSHVRTDSPHSGPEEQKSIVVLPFENMSPDPEQEYFCDGMTEEITSDLTKVRSLRVISRTSAMRLKGTDKDIKAISKELNTRYVLEGSVRRARNSLRITAQLIDAVTDAHLWSEKYRGTIDDVFDIQEKVSRSIVDALKLKLQPEEDRMIADRPLENVQAYECYLRAKREMGRLTEDGINRALRDLQNGLDIVGENALLYAGMGSAYIYQIELGIKVDEATHEKAEEYIHKVLKLDPDSSRSHHLLGMRARHENVTKAIPHFKRALSLDPDSPDTLFWLGAAYSLQAGRAFAAQPLAKRLIEIDPLTPMNYLIPAFAHWMSGELDDALSAFEKSALLEPDSFIAKMWIVYVLTWMDQSKRALELVEQIANPESSDSVFRNFSEQLLFFKYAYLGEEKKAVEVLSNETKQYLWTDPDLCWLGAGFYALLDEREEALRWLEHAIDRGWINYPLLSKNDPFLENIRGEDQFKKLMEKVKYEWEHFEV